MTQLSRHHDGPIVFVLPGVYEATADSGYQAAGDYLLARGIQPIYVDINWRSGGMASFLRQARAGIYRHVAQRPQAPIYLVGFSLGAMLSLILSADLKPRAQILCSLAPLFDKDISRLHWWLKLFAWYVYRDTPERFVYPPLTEEATRRIVFLYGGEEGLTIPPAIQQARRQRYPASRQIVIAGARHKIGQDVYLAQIQAVVEQLPEPMRDA